MAVKRFVRDGTSLSETRDGYEGPEVVHVSGPAVESTADMAQLYEALQDPELPRRRDPHDYVPGLIVLNRQASSLSSDRVRVVLQWGRPRPDRDEPDEEAPGVIEVSTTIETKRASVDRDGNNMVVTYSDPPAGQDEEQLVEAEIMVPKTILRFRRRETGSPDRKSRLFTARVNSAAIGQYDRGELLCIGISGDSQDGGLSYLVTYEFEHDEDGWLLTADYKDDATGRSADGISDGNGRSTFEVYDEANFGDLGLAFP